MEENHEPKKVFLKRFSTGTYIFLSALLLFIIWYVFGFANDTSSSIYFLAAFAVIVFFINLKRNHRADA